MTPDLDKERQSIQRQFRLAGILTCITILGGTTFYHFVEHFSWLDAVYFCIVTLTTIGYGDLYPVTNLGKLFTMLYVLIGIGIIAFFGNMLVKNALIKREMRRAKRLR